MITITLTNPQAELLIEAMKKRIDRSNQKLKYWRAHPEEKAPIGYEITEAHRQSMLNVMIDTLTQGLKK